MRFGIELPYLNVANPNRPARLMGRTNDPGSHRKQIQLQYAGIGESYGYVRSRPATLGFWAQLPASDASRSNRFDCSSTSELAILLAWKGTICLSQTPSPRLCCGGNERRSDRPAKPLKPIRSISNGHCPPSLRRSDRCEKRLQTRVAIAPERWTWPVKPSMKRRPVSNSQTSTAAADLTGSRRHRADTPALRS